jgi:hypothetical protein
MMRKQYLRILIVLIGIAGLSMAAKGQSVDQIVVKIPYEFVAAGKTLPAGTYRVHRLSNSFERILVLSSLENGSSAFIFVTEVESRHDDNARVSFEQAGSELFLSKIQAADHLYNIPVPRSAIMEAATRSHGGTPVEESSPGSK